MEKKSLTTKIKSLFGFGEGSSRPAWGWSEYGQSWPISFGDGWQRGLTMSRGGDHRNATVHACCAAISETIGLLPPQIKTLLDTGEITLTTSSDAYRTLNKPNAIQTAAEFNSMMVNSLVKTGNAYALLVRNDRGAVSAMYPIAPRNCQARSINDSGIVGDTHIFYQVECGIFGADKPSEQMLVPARDILHVRLNATANDPLRGRSALEYAADSLVLNTTITGGLNAFHANKARPSGILVAKGDSLNQEQIVRLRASFESVSSDLAQGKVPVLSGSLDWLQMQSDSAADMRLVELLGKTDADVCRALRVPGELVGVVPNGGQARNPEELNRLFLSGALGFVLEVYEQSLSAALGLDYPKTYVEFDTEYLLRTSNRERWDAYGLAMRSGAITPNEIRAKEGFAPLPGGDSAYIQQQDIPISEAENFARANIDRLVAETNRNNPTSQTVTVVDAPPSDNADDNESDDPKAKHQRIMYNSDLTANMIRAKLAYATARKAGN